MAFTLILLTSLLFEPIAAQNADACFQVKLKEMSFDRNSIQLTSIAKRQLDSSILLIAIHQACKVEVIGGAFECELCSQRVWDRVNAVVSYLIANGISANQLIFRYGDDNQERLVMLQFSTDEGPSIVVIKI